MVGCIQPRVTLIELIPQHIRIKYVVCMCLENVFFSIYCLLFLCCFRYLKEHQASMPRRQHANSLVISCVPRCRRTCWVWWTWFSPDVLVSLYLVHSWGFIHSCPSLSHLLHKDKNWECGQHFPHYANFTYVFTLFYKQQKGIIELKFLFKCS